MHRIFFIASLSLVLLAAACKKKDVPLPLTEIPAIELDSINKTNIIEFQDSLVFYVKYRDGDGDLGTTSPDSTVIEVRDNRDPNNLVFGYHLSPRSPNGATLAVEGTLKIVLKNVIILNSTASSEQANFSIRIKDRAQHWSNEVLSDLVTITR